MVVAVYSGPKVLSPLIASLSPSQISLLLGALEDAPEPMTGVVNSFLVSA